MRSFGILVVGLAVTLSGCGKKTETKTITIPRVETVQVPLSIPSLTSLSIPLTYTQDPGFGIDTFPAAISTASDRIKTLSRATAKVFDINGSSGSGFFISADGLFLTNEHVVPMASCIASGCPGIKLVRDFRVGGDNQVFTDFEVIAQSDSDADFDFTLLKVKLEAGKSVPFLPLELDESAYAFEANDTNTYRVFGHPGGAGLRHTNVKPMSLSEAQIDMRGLVIPGNSGGPLVNVTSGKVVGLVKQTASLFMRRSETAAVHSTFGRATSVLTILGAMKKDGVATATVQRLIGATAIEEFESDADIVVPRAEFALPNRRLLTGALYADQESNQAQRALSTFDKYIGTAHEASVLELLFTNGGDGTLNRQALSSLLKKQIAVGRAFAFSAALIERLDTELTPAAGEGEAFDIHGISARIALHYFNSPRRAPLQAQCESTAAMAGVMAPLIKVMACLSSANVVTLADVVFRQSNYESIDDFGSVTAFLMFMRDTGLAAQADRTKLVALGDFLYRKNNHVQGLMQIDAFITDIVTGVVGPGTFQATYPRN